MEININTTIKQKYEQQEIAIPSKFIPLFDIQKNRIQEKVEECIKNGYSLEEISASSEIIYWHHDNERIYYCACWRVEHTYGLYGSVSITNEIKFKSFIERKETMILRNELSKWLTDNFGTNKKD